MATPKVIAAPTAELIARGEAKLHLRVDDRGGVHPDDSLIDTLIAAAREEAQKYAQVSIGSQTLEIALDAFPEGGEAIKLRRGPVTAITSVTYVDEDGTTQTLSASNYSLDDYSVPPRVVPAYNTEWPSTRDVANAVKVRYVAGWTALTLPKSVKTAMLAHIDLHYPGNSYSPQERESIQQGIDAQLDGEKVY